MREIANAQPPTQGLPPQEEASRYCTFCKASFRMEIPRCPRDGGLVEIREQDPLLGMVLGGRYQIISLLGFGGMGRVYRAQSVAGNETVAVKVLYGDLAADEKMVARFEREARAISRLSSPHIVSIVDFGTTSEGLLYLVMELLAGRPLHEAIAKEGPFDIPRALHICRQVALALSHAHERGLIHRDLKPANVILSEKNGDKDFATILDFGLARMTQAEDPRDSEMLTSMGVIRGTPEFMSPEQARGLELDHRSDLYALGVLLFLMLTQRFPFPRPKSRLDVLTMHVMTPPYPLAKFIKAPEDLEQLVARLLAKETKDRFQSGQELITAIDRFLAGEEFLPLPEAIEDDNEPTRIFALPPDRASGMNTEQVLPLSQEKRPRWLFLAGLLAFLVFVVSMVLIILREYRRAETPSVLPLPSSESTSSIVSNTPPPPPTTQEALNPETPDTPPTPPETLPTPEIEPVDIEVPPSAENPPSHTKKNGKPDRQKKPDKPPRKPESSFDAAAKNRYDSAKAEVDKALRARGLTLADISASDASIASSYREMKALAGDNKYEEATSTAEALVSKIQAFKLDRNVLKAKLSAVGNDISALEQEKGSSVAAPFKKSHQEISSRLIKVSLSPSDAQYESLNQELNALRRQVNEARK